MSDGHGPIEGSNKKIALLVAVLAAFLAISETGGKSAETVVRTAAEELDAQYKDAANMPAAVKVQIEQWRKTAQRYDTEPETNEGRKELMARAKMHEAKREEARAAYHLFEYGSAAFQLAIVLAGASALTAVAWLAFISGGLGLVGAAFTFLGFFAPTLVHL